MSVDLSVLESLGINLYSNAAAVLSELVANAYDADSTFVSISWKQDDKTVVVTDDGSGMTVKQINDRFLTVGYKKRDTEGEASDRFERPYMGRKGIGKLSVFSIAKTVTVYTTRDDESHGLRIKVEDLEAKIKTKQEYHPEPVGVPLEHSQQGTTLVLERLRSKRADLTVNALRKRLARRFDVLDETAPEDGGFSIEVNDKPITFADRQDLRTLEFIWEFGSESLPQSALPDGITRFVLSEDTAGRADWQVKGWIGTARQPTDLTNDEEAGSLKNVIVLARKRPIQEGIIEKLDFSRIFGNYVTGQIEADFLDLDGGYEDIATSDRQRLIEDDDRVQALQKLLRSSFVKAAEQWSAERPKKEAEDVLERFPRLRDWVEERPVEQRKAAHKMIGTIASLTLEKETAAEDRASLLRAGVLAFERVGLRKSSEDLDELSDLTADALLPLLSQQDAYEDALFGDIVRSRIESIERFQGLTEENAKERVLQDHLYKNLWLLDPAWERATGSERMEQALHKVDPDLFPEKPDGSKIVGRYDIRYATLSGRHVIVELKRYEVKLEAPVLAEQGVKYYQALKSVLEKKNQGDPDIEVVFVLGSPPGANDRGSLSKKRYIEAQFANSNGRYVLYDELIENARNQYDEYLKAKDNSESLNDLLKTLEPKLFETGGMDDEEA
ncbi:MAG: ATP-binding protein [Actinobacteria bacterium]|nr:ATP-binding protein [Actinomycetota bacterium]